MTVAPEEVSVRSSSDFLIIVDRYIEAKIIKAEESAAHFASQTDYSIAIKDSFEKYMIPGLRDIRKLIVMTSNTLKESKEQLGDRCDAKAAYATLCAFLIRTNHDIEKYKQQMRDPIAIAGFSLIQGVYTDVIGEVEIFVYKRK